MKFLYVVLVIYPFFINAQLFAIRRVLRDKNNIIKSIKKTPDNSIDYEDRYFNEPNCEELLAMWRYSFNSKKINYLFQLFI